MTGWENDRAACGGYHPIASRVHTETHILQRQSRRWRLKESRLVEFVRNVERRSLPDVFVKKVNPQGLPDHWWMIWVKNKRKWGNPGALAGFSNDIGLLQSAELKSADNGHNDRKETYEPSRIRRSALGFFGGTFPLALGAALINFVIYITDEPRSPALFHAASRTIWLVSILMIAHGIFPLLEGRWWPDEFSTSAAGRSENIPVHAVVVAELDPTWSGGYLALALWKVLRL
jgi:hypothetical protein